MSNTMWKYRPLDWILKATAYLPLRVLYVLADITFVLMYYIIRYRRKVVDKNIIDSFPEKSRQEQQQTIRRFYRHFADYFFETLKLHHISDDEMRRRMTFDNIELIDSLLSQGRSVVAYFSHCGNWEWATSITLWTNHQPEKECVFGQVYRPLKNDWFDQYFLHLRSRFNSRSFPKSSVLRDLIRQLSSGVQGSYYRIAVVDSRGELSCGGGGNNLGENTDVLMIENKALGTEIALRTLSPDIIAFDEIGTAGELKCISDCFNAGVDIITTAHISDSRDLMRRSVTRQLLESGMISNVVLLSKNIGDTPQIYDAEDICDGL